MALLGNGNMADPKTPPERAAAVLADLARLSEAKVGIGNAGGIPPLVMMLSSGAEVSETHAATALWHLSTNGDNKATITQCLDAITKFVRLLTTGSHEGRRYSAGALWQLATSAETKISIVAANGIPALVELLREGVLPEGKESAAAVLSELARAQAANRVAIFQAGGLEPLVSAMQTGNSGAQKHATSALWGLVQETKYRKPIAHSDGCVERLVELLKDTGEGETQGNAAATLSGLAQSDEGRQALLSVGAAGPLMTLALGPQSYLRTQAIDILKVLGYEDPNSRPGMKVAPSQQMLKLQQALAKDPSMNWMVSDQSDKVQPIINDEHMAEFAAKIKVGQRVIVLTGGSLSETAAGIAVGGAATGGESGGGGAPGTAELSTAASGANITASTQSEALAEAPGGYVGGRRAEVMFVGKIPEMPAGYWIGVEYDEPVGKNDGSVKGRRCFECALDYGGFLRPDKIRPDPDPPVARRKPQKEHELMGAEGSLAIDGGALAEANAIPELGNVTARTGSVTARSSASNLASTSTAARSTTPNASLFSR